MAGRARKTTTAPPEQDLPQYALEPLDFDLRSRLNVWGNSTQMCIDQLREKAPGWAAMMEDIFTVVGAAIEEAS